MAATPTATLLSSPSQGSFFSSTRFATAIVPCSDGGFVINQPRRPSIPKRRGLAKIRTTINAVAAATPVLEQIKDCVLPSWAEFDIGRAPIYWKTMNGLPPMSGEKLTVFYNPAASKLQPNEEFGIAFNGGFNQPIMCGGEPRKMTVKTRGKADPPIYTMKICVPKHALNLMFSFTNGVEWDGPYKLQFQLPKGWQTKPISFFNEGLAEELSKEGACERAIFPDSNVVVTRCAMIANLSAEGGDRCSLDLVAGCMDPSSHMFDPMANVDDGSCPLDSDLEDA